MRKILLIFSTLMLIMCLVSCGAKTSNIVYTKEFSYLPAYSSSMKAVSTSPSNNFGLSTANYDIKNTTNTEVFETYENLLKKDGWTIVKDQKPYNIMAKKGAHQVTIVMMQSEKDIKLIIMAK